MNSLLVVAGEASGDSAAAAVVRRLRNVDVFGLGGTALLAAGADLLARMEGHNAMGLVEPLRNAVSVVRSFRSVHEAAKERRPIAALLVGYSEFNMALAPRLRALGIHVLWYAPPQVWAWREGRIAPICRAVEKLALVLPFEEAIWRAGSGRTEATYVGHPCLEKATPTIPRPSKAPPTSNALRVAILPGSRPHEVESLLETMLSGFDRVRRTRSDVAASVLLAPSLNVATRQWAESRARAYDVPVVQVDSALGVGPMLEDFHAALSASGTACLEAAVAGAAPVVLYKVNLLTEAMARLLVRTGHIALPNILLGRRGFDELVQRDVTRERCAIALLRVLNQREHFRNECAAVRATLGEKREPSARVAEMLAPWLETGSYDAITRPSRSMRMPLAITR